jgi:UDP-N-acetylmuramoyl-L-alanyl-D-glutamate--2,6-diaminopimelate ligase
MTLRGLLAGCSIRSISGGLDGEVLGIAYDSRQVLPGFIFVAVRGMQTDGNRFIPHAIAKGATAIVSSSPRVEALAMPWIQVDDEREVLALLAANYYGHPTQKLHLVGITGTNGKTTTTHLVESILRAAGHPAAVLGTIDYRGPGFAYPAERTTPEAPDLEQFFRRVVDAGWQHAVMEVSSHAIALKRVRGLRFDVAVFTNLSHDHLDFHGTMESYFAEKKKLFQGLDGVTPRMLVLNLDDPHFNQLQAIEPTRVLSYGMNDAADIHLLSHHFGWEGTEAVYKTPVGHIDVRSALMGTPNLYNIGAAIGVAIGLDTPPDAIRQGILDLEKVPGRFELIHSKQRFRVIVDYAHTDDALEKVLQSAREITAGKLIVVFGCGGDRDRTKRPLMGEVAARKSDFAVVTSDNPRSENPLAILEEIEQGLKLAGASRGSRYVVCVDRREGIRRALAAAAPGDTVVIAGKGHETYQEVGQQTLDFDDRVVARELLNEFVT